MNCGVVSSISHERERENQLCSLALPISWGTGQIDKGKQTWLAAALHGYSSLSKCDVHAAANVLFLESPAGVGFCYSNTSSDLVVGDDRTGRYGNIYTCRYFSIYGY
jgi:hypothetical protein